MTEPTTLLPIVNRAVFDGLAASNYEPQEIADELRVTNPEVWQFIQHLMLMDRADCAKTCLLLYKILETQAECDELEG